MKLSTKRIKFTYATAQLILRGKQLGYDLAMDYVKRCADCKVGLKNSCHKSGLAVDIIVYINGIPLADLSVFNRLHDYADTVGFSERIEGDLGHFSFEHNGVI